MTHRRRLLVHALGALLGVVPFSPAGADAPPEPRPEDLRTAHYDLHVEGLDPADTGALLEALYVHLAKHFSGRGPDGPLRVEVYSTAERWQTALKATGETAPEAGGYYSPGTRKATLFVQPSEYYTRQLILHEATHQFHFLAATDNRTPAGPWYTEGLAEYFGLHNWDGRTLAVGVVPAISLEDYPARALEHLEAMKWNLEGLISGKVPSERPEAWALVHFLIGSRPEAFRKLAGLLDRGQNVTWAWKQAVGAVTPGFVQEFRAWIESHQQPWRVVWTGWQARGEALEGSSATNAIAVLKESGDTLEAELKGMASATKAGLVFGFQSAEDFHLVQIVDGGQGRVVRREKGGWTVLRTANVPVTDAFPRVAVSCKDGKTTCTINGAPLGEYAAPGALGLNVDSGRVEFRIVK